MELTFKQALNRTHHELYDIIGLLKLKIAMLEEENILLKEHKLDSYSYISELLSNPSPSYNDMCMHNPNENLIKEINKKQK